MTEPIDAYADQFLLSVGPYGLSLSFLVSLAHPDPTKPTPATPVATIRMSVEHAKVMVMVMKRHIQQIEAQLGVNAQVARQLLNQLQIGPEDWDEFWK